MEGTMKSHYSAAHLAHSFVAWIGILGAALAWPATASAQEPGTANTTETSSPGTVPLECASPAAPAETGCDVKPFWTTVPHLSPLPRTGNFLIFPTGPGYYSLADVCHGNYREKAPKNPWPPVSADFFPFYEADFRYLDDPKNQQFDWLDPIKRMHPNDDWLISIGGEERFQYKNESDSRLSGHRNDYELNRVRIYGDVWYQDRFRVYAEFLSAESFNQDLAPLAIDRDHGDLLNAFVDLKVCELDGSPAYVRAGRQELCYGSQRIISPLDWANTRRTFEGVKTFWRSENLDVDLFWVRPVLVRPAGFDTADSNRDFWGLWTTYRPQKGQAIDLYCLDLEDERRLATPLPRGALRGGANTTTFGGRYVGDYEHFLWDFEGMYQTGTNVNRSISADAFTTGVGYQFVDLPMAPEFCVYNDFASGDHDGSRRGTFNQLFPFGHFYFGFIDVVGRQNIEDFNLHLNVYPTNWITGCIQAHFFYLDSAKDALYNAAGAATLRDPTGRSGHHVGDELDFFINFHLTTHHDILIGYSHLFAGEFIQKAGNGQSPDLSYIQYSFKF
jgi:hypothetical protein